MNAHFAFAGGFELDYAARSGDRRWCDEFYKSRLALSLALATVGGHQKPFQFPGVEVQLLRGRVHTSRRATLMAIDHNSSGMDVFRERVFLQCSNRARARSIPLASSMFADTGHLP